MRYVAQDCFPVFAPQRIGCNREQFEEEEPARRIVVESQRLHGSLKVLQLEPGGRERDVCGRRRGDRLCCMQNRKGRRRDGGGRRRRSFRTQRRGRGGQLLRATQAGWALARLVVYGVMGRRLGGRRERVGRSVGRARTFLRRRRQEWMGRRGTESLHGRDRREFLAAGATERARILRWCRRRHRPRTAWRRHGLRAGHCVSLRTPSQRDAAGRQVDSPSR
jgi:hypothetical protein